jgi:Transposase DDE domain
VAGPSLTAALDLDGDYPAAQPHALPMMLDALRAVAHWLDAPPVPEETPARAGASLAVAQQGSAQDLTTTPEGTPLMRQGVAAERRIRVEETEMRHGRTSRSLLVDGYKRHVWRDVDARLIVAVGVTPATVSEARVTDAIETDWAAQQCPLRAWPIERASLASPLVQQRPATLAIFGKAWPVQQGPFFPKTAFTLDWPQHVLPCPGGVTRPCEPGGRVQCPAATCARCALRLRCTTSASGRSVSMPPDEALLHEGRERQQTPPGRAKWRERVAVEHALAHLGHWQGRRARYRGGRKNVFDLRRCAVIHHLHV